VWRSSNGKAEDDLTDIYKCTTAILFLGTPHRGSDYAHRAKVLSRIAYAVGFDTNDRNIKSLAVNSNDLILCQENFMSLYEDKNRQFSVRTFQEAVGWTGKNFLGMSGKV
jgi:ankyrin repeat domain-containing protein 50